MVKEPDHVIALQLNSRTVVHGVERPALRLIELVVDQELLDLFLLIVNKGEGVDRSLFGLQDGLSLLLLGKSSIVVSGTEGLPEACMRRCVPLPTWVSSLAMMR